MSFSIISLECYLVSMFIIFLSNCNNDETYKYNVVQKTYQGGRLVLESPMASFVSVNDSLLEYEIATINRKEIGADGSATSDILTYDTLGLYLLNPLQNRYFKVSSRSGKLEFLDMGGLEQKKFGLSFNNALSKVNEVAEPYLSRDTLIDGVKLKVYQKFDIKAGLTDTLVVRYYFFDSISISSVLTYVTEKRFTEEKGVFRVEIESKKDNYLYAVSISNLEKLDGNQYAQFRKNFRLGDR